jgi:hypothetical protein
VRQSTCSDINRVRKGFNKVKSELYRTLQSTKLLSQHKHKWQHNNTRTTRQQTTQGEGSGLPEKQSRDQTQYDRIAQDSLGNQRNKHNMTESHTTQPWQPKAYTKVIRKGKLVLILDLRPSPFLRLNGAREVRLALMVVDGRTRNGQGGG